MKAAEKPDSPAHAGAERRRVESRGETAAPAPTLPGGDESWFGALGADSRLRGDDTLSDLASGFETHWDADAALDPRALSRHARRILHEQDSALTRIFRSYTAARAAIGVALVLGIGAIALMGATPTLALNVLCLAYAVQALTLWLLPRFDKLALPQPGDGVLQRRRQWLWTVGVDLVAFTGLHWLASEGSLNFAALLVLPVLMAGVLTSRLIALATASAAALMLLAFAWHGAAAGTGGALLITQSGLAGMGLFAIALLAGELAGRLAREEAAARGSMQFARQQARLNRLVIEEMADGVLVVDRDLRVRATNPAARSLLWSKGLGPAAPFQLQSRAPWAALCAAVQQALAESYWPDAGDEVQLDFGPGDVRSLRLRVRFTRRRPAAPGQGAGEDLCVLLLEDVRTVQARLRQERLAAMGRVSAGIAHEIRNPLAAIAQANALLMEDALPEPQQRLTRMVADNVARLKRLVDDVMEATPAADATHHRADAAEVVRAATADWARTAALPDGLLRLELPMTPLPVVFDAEHLRRVLVNLLDNALRHCSRAAGAIGVRLVARDAHSALLRVDSDGEAITPDVERYLFEPFFSTRSRGSGLGLYICRELCERHGASIDYRLRPDGQRNLFLVIMRREGATTGKAPSNIAQ